MKNLIYIFLVTVISIQSQAQVRPKNGTAAKKPVETAKPVVVAAPLVSEPDRLPVPAPQILKMNQLKSLEVKAAPVDLTLFRPNGGNTFLGVALFPEDGYEASFQVKGISFSGFSSMGLGAVMTVKVQKRWKQYDGTQDYTYNGHLMIQSCESSGKPILKEYSSLAEVFLDDNNIADDLIESCVFTGARMNSSWMTPGTASPYAFWDSMQLLVSGDGAKLTVGKVIEEGTKKGQKAVSGTDWLFISTAASDNLPQQTIDEVNRILGIYEKALAIIRTEQTNRELPETVLYLNSQRPLIKSSLGLITASISKNEVSARQVLNIMISFRMAVHKLDQALGLASSNQIKIGNFVQK